MATRAEVDGEAVRHPIFARVFDRLSRKVEDRGQAEHRGELLAGLAGRVIEVGAGNGLNFPHYPTAVAEVIAVEPEPYLRERAREAAATAGAAIRVVDGTAERLPAEAASFDAGCHSSRETAAAIAAAGFEIEACRSFRFAPSPLVALVAPHVLGVARR